MSKRVFQPARHHGSWHHPDQFRVLCGPKGPLAHLVIAGRSNAGKSSLINCLFGEELARVSRSPGKTRALELFLSGGRGREAVFIDLPGYGYARRSHQERSKWHHLIESFLSSSPALQGIVIVTDSRHAPFELDLQMVQWALSRGIPAVVLLNKWDASSQSERVLCQRAWTELDWTSHVTILPFSCKTGAGQLELEALLTDWIQHAPSR